MGVVGIAFSLMIIIFVFSAACVFYWAARFGGHLEKHKEKE